MSIITFSDRLSKFLMVAAAAWTFGLAFLVMGNIIGRFAFDAPIYGTAEIVAASIVIVVFLQTGYAIRSRSMLKADFLVIHLPDVVQRTFLAIGCVSRGSPVQTAVRNCTRDEGGPFGFGDQELIPSYRKLLWSKAMVVSVAEKSGR